MIERLLDSRNFVARLLAAATGLVLYKHLHPFSLHYPYICYSVLVSGMYSFALRIPQCIRPGRLPRISKHPLEPWNVIPVANLRRVEANGGPGFHRKPKKRSWCMAGRLR